MTTTETPFIRFWRQLCDLADAAGLPRPTFGPARDAFEEEQEQQHRQRVQDIVNQARIARS